MEIVLVVMWALVAFSSSKNQGRLDYLPEQFFTIVCMDCLLRITSIPIALFFPYKSSLPNKKHRLCCTCKSAFHKFLLVPAWVGACLHFVY